MKTLYDVLGIRPDASTEGLKRAFRNGVRASHPDVHPGDPDAPVRFRQVVKAYAILRDPETRADYDRLLELEREQLRATPRRYTVRKFVFDGVAAASLAAVMAGGYTLLADIPSSVKMTKVVAGPWHGPTEIDALPPSASTDTTNHDDPRQKLAGVEEVLNTATAPSGAAFGESVLASAANSGGAPGIAHGGPASSTAVPDILVADITGAFGATVYQAHVKSKSDSAAEPLDHEPMRSVGLQPSVEWEPSSDFARSKSANRRNGSDKAAGLSPFELFGIMPGEQMPVGARKGSTARPKPSNLKQRSGRPYAAGFYARHEDILTPSSSSL